MNCGKPKPMRALKLYPKAPWDPLRRSDLLDPWVQLRRSDLLDPWVQLRRPDLSDLWGR